MDRPAKALALCALLAAPLLMAGCTNEDTTRASPEVIRAVANTEATSWEQGNWWAYRATFHQNRTYDIALVVHEARQDGFRLGSNLSSGFFGLPFSGNVTTELNPQIGGKVWPMFQFPLSDGMSWTYNLFGYDAETTAYAAMVDVPGLGPRPGFRFESTSYGQVFARYDYALEVGWFTRLELIEPTDRTQVLDVRLDTFGTRYGGGYFVERVIKTVDVTYPGSIPGQIEVVVPKGFQRVHVSLTAEATAGVVDAKVVDAAGRSVVEARAVGKGLSAQRATLREGGHRWTLEHAGSGVAGLYLEVTGVRAAGASPVAWQRTDERVDLAALLASTRA